MLTWERVLQTASIVGLLAAVIFLWLWRLDAALVAAALGSVTWFLRLRRELKDTLAQHEEEEHES